LLSNPIRRNLKLFFTPPCCIDGGSISARVLSGGETIADMRGVSVAVKGREALRHSSDINIVSDNDSLVDFTFQINNLPSLTSRTTLVSVTGHATNPLT
jgi:hypothetical protein